MVIDTSALIAILQDEPERSLFNRYIAEDSTRLLSAVSFVETALVIESRFGEAGGQQLDLFLNQAEILVVAVDVEQADLARIAYRKYGKGRHRAGLNFGDCFAYALAKTRGLPLLFKGSDFSQTDIAVAWQPSQDQI